MSTNLKVAQFGNDVLRRVARSLTLPEIRLIETQYLIENMHFTLTDQKLGIGLAAPQVGESIAVAVINIHKTDVRPDVEELKLTIINPVITQTFGRKTQMWEGCLSSGLLEAGMFAKVPRYKKVELEYYDQNGDVYTSVFEGLPAHVIQHEVDHLNSMLFVDKVKDTKTYMTYTEYRKMRSGDQ